MWMCKDGMFFGKEFGNLGLFFFFVFFLYQRYCTVWSLVAFSNTKREIGGRMIIRVSSKV